MKQNLLKFNSVFIGGGVPHICYLWLLPVVDGFCTKNNIKHLIFETDLPKNLFKNQVLKKILKKYSLNFSFRKNFISYLLFFLYFCKNIKLFISLIFIKKDLILNKNNSNFQTYLYHSMWDTSFQKKNYFLYPNLIIKIISATKIIYKLYIGDILVRMNTSAAFLVHSIYHHRMLCFKLMCNKIKVFVENDFTSLTQHKSFYNNYNLIEKKYFKKFYTNFLKNKKIVQNYWNLRSLGKGNKLETYSISFGKLDFYKDYVSNVIMLPVLKESHFIYIDKKRIFTDCIDWLKYTLKVIGNSKEKWIIKPHPSMHLWGEDTKKIIDLILENSCKNFKNIKYVKNISNREVFFKAKKIVTFNGTCQIESGCYGIKPIVISRIDYNYYNNKLVLIPKTLEEYKELLLKSSDSNIFKLNQKELMNCKFFIFFKEKVLSLNSEVGKFYELRNSSKKTKKNNYNLVSNNIIKNHEYLFYLGSLLAKNIRTTISKKYIEYFVNK